MPSIQALSSKFTGQAFFLLHISQRLGNSPSPQFCSSAPFASGIPFCPDLLPPGCATATSPAAAAAAAAEEHFRSLHSAEYRLGSRAPSVSGRRQPPIQAAEPNREAELLVC